MAFTQPFAGILFFLSVDCVTFLLNIGACLKIEEVPDFCSKMVSFKEKTARQTGVCRGFLTQKMTVLGQKDGAFDFSNKP